MTKAKYCAANKVLARLLDAQLHCHGELPVVVLVHGKEKLVVTARYNRNSGNVELTVQE